MAISAWTLLKPDGATLPGMMQQIENLSVYSAN
ncbi:hypothetical protein T4B_14619 [Trichinella pseudospiralis]|uniref:Uncharacterized protein n=1 Tax=Trichinella pseudospiralis TaxID=6337 RepID=A0A0V1GS37_TRIPS|nr:hypothetical protein T4B_14619 [Trichinella pseudospiralis]